MPQSPSSRPLSALPSPLARALAFVAILIGGAAGGVIGWALVDVGCTGGCGTSSAIAGIIGAIIGAGGTAIVAVLVLRAMGEWHEFNDRNRGA